MIVDKLMSPYKKVLDFVNRKWPQDAAECDFCFIPLTSLFVFSFKEEKKPSGLKVLSIFLSMLTVDTRTSSTNIKTAFDS